MIEQPPAAFSTSKLDDDETDPIRLRFLTEMWEGYLDGRKPDNPEPSSNRSSSYQHGFANGRDDLAKSPRALGAELRQMAETAISDDAARLAPVSSTRLTD